MLADGHGASDLGTSSTVDDPVILYQVPHHAHGVVQGPLRLVDDHLVSSPHDAGDGGGVLAVLNDDHLLLGGPKGDLADLSTGSELVGTEFTKPRDDAGSCGKGDKLELDASDPADGGELVLEEEVVGLIVESPLADDEVGCDGVVASKASQGEGLVVVLVVCG